jgi:four helix bundle protein
MQKLLNRLAEPRGVVSPLHRGTGSERTTPADFSRFLDIAKGSVGEVRSMYRLAVRLGFVPINIADIRSERCKSISRQLGGFAKFLRSK